LRICIEEERCPHDSARRVTEKCAVGRKEKREGKEKIEIDGSLSSGAPGRGGKIVGPALTHGEKVIKKFRK